MLFSAPESVRSSYLERCNDGFEENNIFLQKVHFWISCVFFLCGGGGVGWVAMSRIFQEVYCSSRNLRFVVCCLSRWLTSVRCKMAPMSKAEKVDFGSRKRRRWKH